MTCWLCGLWIVDEKCANDVITSSRGIVFLDMLVRQKSSGVINERVIVFYYCLMLLTLFSAWKKGMNKIQLIS